LVKKTSFLAFLGNKTKRALKELNLSGLDIFSPPALDWHGFISSLTMSTDIKFSNANFRDKHSCKVTQVLFSIFHVLSENDRLMGLVTPNFVQGVKMLSPPPLTLTMYTPDHTVYTSSASYIHIKITSAVQIHLLNHSNQSQKHLQQYIYLPYS
jgi:hypothetical protein